jgi:hypothetical protein
MNFNDAWNEALKVTPPEDRPKGNIMYAKVMAMMWTILAIAGKKGLDDIAYINENKDIVSIPLKKSASTKKTGKGKSKKKDEAVDTPEPDPNPEEKVEEPNGENTENVQETTEEAPPEEQQPEQPVEPEPEPEPEAS